MATITCPKCGEAVPLRSGVGDTGDKRFECSNGHVFGKAPRSPEER